MRRHEETTMRRLYEEWRESGESKTAFARHRGIVPVTFYYWVRKFKESAIPLPGSGFQLFTAEGPKSNPLMVIRYPSGITAELYAPIDSGLLKSLLQ